MTDPRWLDDTESRAWRGLIRLGWLLDVAIARDLGLEAGLSHPDYQVLVALSEAPGRRLRMSELATALLWSKSRLSHQIGRMEVRRLVDREGCAGDARGAFAVLTAAGFRAIQEAAPGHVESIRRHLFDHLGPAEVEALAGITERVVAHLNSIVPCAPACPPADPGCGSGEDVGPPRVGLAAGPTAG